MSQSNYLLSTSEQDRTYSELITEFESLNKQFKDFLNNDHSAITEAGKIPSLRKIIDNLEKISYVKKVLVYRTLDLANASIQAFDSTDIIEVNGDPDKAKNGYYKKSEAAPNVFVLVKVSYKDISGFDDYPGSGTKTWEFNDITKVLFYYDIEKSEVSSWLDRLKGTLEFRSDGYLYAADININVALLANLDASEVIATGEFVTDEIEVFKPFVEIQLIDNGSTYTVICSYNGPETTEGDAVYGTARITIDGLVGDWYQFGT